MKQAFLRSFFSSIFILLLSNNISAEDKKVALIWGNATYKNTFQDLPVVNNDVSAMAKVLRSLGFETDTLVNGSIDDMKRIGKKFISRAKNADIAVFYYSGHALMINGNYYIVPSKTQFEEGGLLASDYFPALDVKSFLNNSRVKLFFFDACRDDATPEGFAKGNPHIEASEDVGPSSYQGSKKPVGEMWLYASEKGKKAYTGAGDLSTFTKVLSAHLTDGDEFRTVWNNVVKEVYAIQNQKPVNEEVYENSLYLNPSGKKYTPPEVKTKNITNNVTDSPITNKKSISVVPNVSDATIDFNGKKYDAGKPLLFEIGKTYTYTITADGYNAYIGRLEVTDLTPSTIDITMTKDEAATLNITSNTKATVSLDGDLKGITPAIINTTSGPHKLKVSAIKKNYYDYETIIDLNPGANGRHISLTYKTPWFFDWDDYDAPIAFFSYSFSPKYPIGLQTLFRVDDTPFLWGLNIAMSTGLFRGLKIVDTNYYGTFTNIDEANYTYVNGNLVKETETTITTTLGTPTEYSKEIDPYNEAKKYDANFIALLSGGCLPCNGLLIEAGIGWATHRDKYYMPNYYSITKTVTTNNITGEVVGEPEYKYTKMEKSAWYNNDVVFSPAMRLGLKFNIPVEDNVITIGGGYNYLFTNKQFSSWDISIGFGISDF